MAPFEPATVDPPLHGDVSFGFQLQIAFARIVAVLVPKRSLDIHGMSIVAVDEVRVIAIHRAHKIGKRPENLAGRLARNAEAFRARSRVRSVRCSRCRGPSSNGSIDETISSRSSVKMSASMAACVPWSNVFPS
jgi:hypothetical protein